MLPPTVVITRCLPTVTAVLMQLYCPGLTNSLPSGRSTPATAATAAAALPRLPISGRYFQRRPLPAAEFRRHKLIRASV